MLGGTPESSSRQSLPYLTFTIADSGSSCQTDRLKGVFSMTEQDIKRKNSLIKAISKMMRDTSLEKVEIAHYFIFCMTRTKR